MGHGPSSPAGTSRTSCTALPELLVEVVHCDGRAGRNQSCIVVEDVSSPKSSGFRASPKGKRDVKLPSEKEQSPESLQKDELQLARLDAEEVGEHKPEEEATMKDVVKLPSDRSTAEEDTTTEGALVDTVSSSQPSQFSSSTGFAAKLPEESRSTPPAVWRDQNGCDREEMRREVSAGATTLRTGNTNFHGEWLCTSTWGLDAFLQGNGVPKLQRMAAAKAPWPTWEFQQDGSRFVYKNHSMMGELKEEFEVGGPEYTVTDGRKQKLVCKAFWDGEALIIERDGPQGKFREERCIKADGRLHFELTGLQESNRGSWGRTFRRSGGA